jgi:hypothetical protein
VAEVARIKEDPIEIKVGEGSLSFIYADGRWVRTQVLSQDWPVEKMNSIFNRPSAAQPLPDGFFDAVEKLLPFAATPAAPLYFTKEGMSTAVPGSEEGAFVAMAGLPPKAGFRSKALQLLIGEIDTIDFSLHPAPCLFFGPSSRGALIGISI